MAMIIQNNLMALSAQRHNSLNNLKLQSSLMKLASGYRINSAADDAAGLAVSERMRAQQTGLERAIANAQDGVSLVQTAEGALTEVHSMLNRLTELATQASNGIYNDSQRASLNREASDILKEIDRISQATNFNGIKVLDGSLNAGGAASVAVSGLAVSQSAATAASTEYAMADIAGLSAGDSIQVELNLSDGSSSAMEFTVSDDLTRLVAGDGQSYAIGGSALGGQVNASADALAEVIAGQLQGGSAGESFAVSAEGGAITMESREAGAGAARVNSFSIGVNGGAQSQVAVSSHTPAADAEYSISQDSLRVYDGTNEAAATFAVNGQEFILAAAGADVGGLENTNVNVIRVGADSGAGLSQADLRGIAAQVNQKTGMAFSATAEGLRVDAPDSAGGLRLQVGDTPAAYNQISVGIPDMSARGLGIAGIDLSTLAGAEAAMARIASARDMVSSTRGELGATQNRLSSTISNLQVTNENITAAESRIRDADMAKMIMDFTKRNILSQASNSMLAQANLQSQQVLQLLR